MDKLNLDIEGFGVINQANIEINKITVVGGVNASGKSTASKLLYCFLKAMSLNRKEYILKMILPEINSFINTVESPQTADHNLPNKFTIYDDINDILRGYEIARKKFSQMSDDFVIPREFIYEQKIFNIDKYIPILKDNLEDNYSSVVKSLFRSESLITYKGKSTFYSNSFKSYVSSKNTKMPYDTLMERGWNLKEDNISFDDIDRNFVYNSEGNFDWLNDVFFIDSISLFDLSFYLDNILEDDNYKIEYKEHINQLLTNLSGEWEIDDEKIEEKINAVKKIFRKSFKNFDLGRDKIIENFMEYYGDYGFLDYIHQITANISSGIQQIDVVKRLLYSNKLIPGTFLIIDEPEVNLHPEWQFKFAEILVLLAKELDVKIYLNSHSPMFIEAIEVLTKYYDLEEYTNFYMTEKHDENTYNFVKVDYDNLYDLYDNLAKPYEAIEAYRLKAEYKKGNY